MTTAQQPQPHAATNTTLGTNGAAGVAPLRAALRGLKDAYDALYAIMDKRRDAIQRADAGGLSATLEEESDVLRRITDLDHGRTVAAEGLADVVVPAQEPRPEKIGVQWLLERLPERLKEGLAQDAAALRAVLDRTRARNAVDAVAAERLAAHMRGLLTAAYGGLSHSGGYSARGVVEPGPSVCSALDVTT